MQKLTSNIFLEDGYPAVLLGLIVSGDDVVLIDCPLRVDDARAWLSTAAELGRPRFMALLDHQQERVLGARSLDLTIVSQENTQCIMAGWSDTFKGSSHPMGTQADRIKRITGVSKATPDLSFSRNMVIHLHDGEVHFSHGAGPTSGAMWVVSHQSKVAFIGDAVSLQEPPYIGDANLDAWLESLDRLRGNSFEEYRLISSRDALITRDDINAMARFLRMVQLRMEKLAEFTEPEALGQAAMVFAQQLLARYDLEGTRRARSLLRLHMGLINLHRKMFPQDE